MENFYEIKNVIQSLFGKGNELLPSVTEMFELEMAFLEFNALSKPELLEKSAYIKTINGEYSKHFLMYSDKLEKLNKNRSPKTKSYFESGQFSTGYATHSLFPYRGKFHPQLVKGILNITGVKTDEIVLDPMAGSGTTNVEAALMGIDSYAIDVSPFCQLMIDTKYSALSIDIETLKTIKFNHHELFLFFQKGNIIKRLAKVGNIKKQKIYKLALLAFLDAYGYSMRLTSSTHEELFEKVLNRYIETVKHVRNNKYINNIDIGKTTVLNNSDALHIDLDDNSIDSVITSPPYSFAIDYVENDKIQLEYLGYDTNELKTRLIGLKGKQKKNKLEIYFDDMDKVCNEIGRVLKPQKFFTMIIGSNTNQTRGIRLEQTIIDSAEKYKLNLVKKLLKPIKGMRNTMKEEYILIFKKQ
jgi:tRNA G10  N-methylase Trm11